jgi:hypothetical protein
MKTIQITTWLILITTFGFGQNVVRDRLNAKRVNTRVVLNFTGDFKTPRYTIDEKDYRIEDYGWNHEFNKRTTFAIHDETANLQLRFLNPLRYRVEISSKETDDPVAQAIDKFIDNSIIIGRAIGRDSLVKGFFPFEKDKDILSNKLQVAKSLTAAAQVPATIAKLEGNVKDAQSLQMRTIMLFDWYMFTYNVDTLCITQANRDTLFKKICKLDEILYLESFSNTVRSSFNKIKDTDTILEFKKMLKNAQNNIDQLETANEKNKESFKNIKNFEYETITNKNSTEFKLCENHEYYSEAKLYAYKDYAKNILNNRTNILKNYSTLCDELEKYLVDSDEKRNTVMVESLKSKNGKINEMTIAVKSVEWEEKDKIINENFTIKSKKEISKATFNAVPFSTVITEFGMGVLYFFDPINFPKYGLITNPDGSNTKVVAQTGNEQAHFLPCPTLTILPRWGTGDVFWQFQVGATMSNNLPVIHVGGGLRLFSINNSFVTSVSIMGGVAARFTRELNALNIGEISTADKLDKDLSTQLKGPVYPYIGFQFNF